MITKETRNPAAAGFFCGRNARSARESHPRSNGQNLPVGKICRPTGGWHSQTARALRVPDSLEDRTAAQPLRVDPALPLPAPLSSRTESQARSFAERTLA